MTASRTLTYELRVAGHLDDHWSAWLGELTITRHSDGTTTLTGPVADQTQLHGVLARLRDIGATLMSLNVIQGPYGHARESPGWQQESRQGVPEDLPARLTPARWTGASVADVRPSATFLKGCI